MRIDKRLNLVIPVFEGEADKSPIIAYVHSTPLAEAVVDKWFVVLGRTFSEIWEGGFGFASGPAHSARVLRAVAEKMDVWRDRKGEDKEIIPGVERGLLAEILRLTSVLAPGQDGAGWVSVPWDVAIQQGTLTDEDQREVQNAIVFFIVAYATLSRSQRRTTLERAFDIWGGQLTSSTATEFGTSLKTSTGTDNSGEKTPAAAKGESGPARAGSRPTPRSLPV